ncbi:MAG: alpha/beta hydrolase [Gemmatimonadaceae bacterium]
MIREIPGPSGRLEVLLDEPSVEPMHAAVVLAHPHPQYGGTMHTKAVYQSAKAFARIGCAVLRFNFRGAGASAGTFSDGPGELDDCRAALDFMHDRYPSSRLWAGGMSFGAWVGLTVGSADSRVSTIIGIAPPLSRYDFEPVRTSAKAKFFIQGERDEICPLKEMQRFYAQCVEPKELVVIDAADHLFDGKVSEVADAIEDLFGDWYD